MVFFLGFFVYDLYICSDRNTTISNHLLMINIGTINQIELKHISEVQNGQFVGNLGKVLEINELENHYSLVIERMNEKQVFKFEKDFQLIIT